MAKDLEIQLGAITNANLMQLKTINIATLPVRYTEKFYKDLIVNIPHEYLRFAFWNGFAVGAVCARIENHDKEDYHKLYIMTINVLPAYRRRGIGSSSFLILTSIHKSN
jgi:ribosomal protein S18 acetylase RimI-like enzyme